MDTGQPGLAPENVALDNAADAFKAFLAEEPITPEPQRDEQGRFARAEPEGDAEEEEAAPQGEDEIADDGEAAEEAQPEPIDMPSSWSKDDQDVWEALPAEAQAKIVEREAERDRGLNLKLQEAANVRKDFESRLTEANVNRDKFAEAIDTVLSLVQPQTPSPYDFGYGTANYDRDAYDIARTTSEQQMGIIQQLVQQRHEIAAQQAQEAQDAARAQHDEIEQAWFPKLVETVPGLKDQTKAPDVVNSIIRYAVDSGIPEHVMAQQIKSNSLTSAEMLLAWKAMQWDNEQAAKARVKAGNIQPKPASPPVRPGTVASRQSIQTRNLRAAQERLTQEGSIEAAADVFKQLAPLR